jgi:MinD-like ATPase involved in chromosome partitioning or flagellar assembly
MSSTSLAIHVMKTLALTSGKGGVGKSNIAINLAITLALRGNKVCILDADTGLANINILLGVAPQHTLEHLLNGEKTLAEILVKGPAGIHIIPGASGVADCVELAPEQQMLLMRGLDDLEPHYDYLIIDTGAGISSTVLHFVAAAQMPIVVITPEPTSLTDAFSLLKVLRRNNFKRPVQVVVNMASGVSKAQHIFNRFQAAVDKYIGLQIIFLGSICRDQAIVNAVARQYPVVLGAPGTQACQDFNLLADNIDNSYKASSIKSLRFSRYWLQRMHNAAQAKRAQASPPETKTETPKPIQTTTLTPQAFAESIWVSASTQLKQLIELGGIHQQQIDELINELRMLATTQSEAAQLTSPSINPDPTQQSNLNASLPKKSNSKQTHSQANGDIAHHPDAEVSTHQYDESTFGSQELLLKKLREVSVSDTVPLLAFLEDARNNKTYE